MWLSILIVVGLVGGLALALTGIGFLGIPLVIVGVVAFAMLMVNRGQRGSGAGKASPSGHAVASTGASANGSPQDTSHAARHIKTGTAHPGQENMTP